MKRILKWGVAAVVAGGVGVGVWTLRLRAADPDEGKKAGAATTEPAKAEEKAPPGHLKLKGEEVEHAGIKSEEVSAGTYAPEVKLFGVLVEDPDASFTVRAPAAGTIVGAEGKPWPSVGQKIGDKAAIGALQQRLAPADQIALTVQQVTLQTQLTTAQTDATTAAISLSAAKAAYERLKALNAQDKNVSDRVVEEALTKVKTEEVHVEGANRTVELVRRTLASPEVKAGAIPLEVGRGGEVAEVTARPGESIESGQPIVRVVDFGRAIASVYAGPGESLPANVKAARVVPFGVEGKSFEGTAIGTAAAADPKTRQRAMLFKMDLGGAGSEVRPGAPVTAYVKAEGEPLKGVMIPKAAVVRYLGKAWVYVAGGTNEFDRKEVSLDHPAPDGSGWFVIEGFKGGEQVVTVGPQTLLSMEINAAFGGGG